MQNGTPVSFALLPHWQEVHPNIAIKILILNVTNVNNQKPPSGDFDEYLSALCPSVVPTSVEDEGGLSYSGFMRLNLLLSLLYNFRRRPARSKA